MPEMMSFTSVCAPKPTATPTTPAPAINGPIWTPIADSAISAAMTRKTMKRMLRSMGRSVRMRDRRLTSLGSAALAPELVTWMRWSMRVRTTCQAKSATSRIRMPLNSPRSSRVTVVSVAVREFRSIPQPHARSRMAPTIRTALAPRSSAAASKLGGPLVFGAPGGVRIWFTDRSTTLTAAGRAAATATSQNAFMAPNTHMSHSAANSMETPSVIFLARSRRDSSGSRSAGRRHSATMARPNSTRPSV